MTLITLAPLAIVVIAAIAVYVVIAGYLQRRKYAAALEEDPAYQARLREIAAQKARMAALRRQLATDIHGMMEPTSEERARRLELEAEVRARGRL